MFTFTLLLVALFFFVHKATTKEMEKFFFLYLSCLVRSLTPRCLNATREPIKIYLMEKMSCGAILRIMGGAEAETKEAFCS